MNARFDLFISHADIVTVVDRFETDIGIARGRVVALGASAVPRGASAAVGEAA